MCKTIWKDITEVHILVVNNRDFQVTIIFIFAILIFNAQDIQH